jgi:hypothetical protein
MSVEYLAGMVFGLLAGALVTAIALRGYTERQIEAAWNAAKKALNEELAQEAREGKLFTPSDTGKWKCVMCGCTDENACEGGCWWVYPNLCSACAEKLISGGYDFEEATGNE